MSPIAPIPRHLSGSSVTSEMSFPVRPDAYQATDISMRPGDDLSSTKSPPSYLPYPSLAASPSRNIHSLPPTVRSYQVPLSNGSSRTGGFFASIGRKASLKKDRTLAMSPPSPSRMLTKRLPAVASAPVRPIQMNHAPSIPGGPRAPPGRMVRSQTISVAPAPVEFLHQQQQPPPLPCHIPPQILLRSLLIFETLQMLFTKSFKISQSWACILFVTSRMSICWRLD